MSARDDRILGRLEEGVGTPEDMRWAAERIDDLQAEVDDLESEHQSLDDDWDGVEVDDHTDLLRDLAAALDDSLACAARYCTCDAHTLMRRAEDVVRGA